MSTYRSLNKVPINDVYAERLKKPDDASTPAHPATADEQRQEDERRQKRKGQPANVPFPRTLAWAASLSHEIPLTALLRSYPRIANVIAAAWNDPATAWPYLEDLMVDQRGRRQGFPSEVKAELATLHNLYARLHPVHVAAWPKAGKRD